MDQLVMNRERLLSEIHVLGQGLVVGCIRPIQWLLLLKLWECLFHTGRKLSPPDHLNWQQLAMFLSSYLLFFPESSSIPAEDPLKLDECRLAGKYLLELLKMDLKPRDIITHKSLRNAMVIVMALGGSTNAVLHLIAIAR